MPVLQEHQIQIRTEFFKRIFHLANCNCQSHARNIEAVCKGKC